MPKFLFFSWGGGGWGGGGAGRRSKEGGLKQKKIRQLGNCNKIIDDAVPPPPLFKFEDPFLGSEGAPGPHFFKS